MYLQLRYKTGYNSGTMNPSPTPPFNPITGVAGLKHWFEVSPTDCYTDAAMTIHGGENDPIHSWRPRHTELSVIFVQNTLQARPLLKQISGRWVLRFDGIDDKMIHSGTWAQSQASGMTVMLIFNPLITTSIQRPIARWGSISPSWTMNITNTQLQFHGWNAGNTPSVTIAKGTNARMLMMGGFGSGNNRVGKNKAAMTTSTTTVVPLTTSNELVTLSNTDDGVPPYAGDIGAILFTDVPPNDAERIKVCDYYGIV